MNPQDDVLVLGSGHNGLVCACCLAAAGKRVRILERRSIVGGAAVTEEFHPGFRNSTASYTVGLLGPGIVRDLKLHEHGLRIVPRPMANFMPLPNGASLSIYNDDADTAREFARFSPCDAEALSGFRGRRRGGQPRLAARTGHGLRPVAPCTGRNCRPQGRVGTRDRRYGCYHPSHAAYRGPIAGLYHCGAGAHPGGGVSGIPGRNAAREILRDLRKGGR